MTLFPVSKDFENGYFHLDMHERLHANIMVNTKRLGFCNQYRKRIVFEEPEMRDPFKVGQLFPTILHLASCTMQNVKSSETLLIMKPLSRD